MVLQNDNSDNTQAVLRTEEVAEDSTALPWEQEGEFEIDTVVMSQSHGELLVKVNVNGKQSYLTIVGFLPGNVTGQSWRLTCSRESGKIELLDGEPI
jgi:hypothetical protein